MKLHHILIVTLGFTFHVNATPADFNIFIIDSNVLITEKSKINNSTNVSHGNKEDDAIFTEFFEYEAALATENLDDESIAVLKNLDGETNAALKNLDDETNAAIENLHGETNAAIKSLYDETNISKFSTTLGLTSSHFNWKKLIKNAKKKAEKIKRDAQKEAEKIKRDAQKKAKKIIRDGQKKANKLVGDGKKKANKIVGDGKKKTNKIVEDGKKKANKIVGDGKKKANKIINDAIIDASKITSKAVTSNLINNVKKAVQDADKAISDAKANAINAAESTGKSIKEITDKFDHALSRLKSLSGCMGKLKNFIGNGEMENASSEAVSAFSEISTCLIDNGFSLEDDKEDMNRKLSNDGKKIILYAEEIDTKFYINFATRASACVTSGQCDLLVQLFVDYADNSKEELINNANSTHKCNGMIRQDEG